VQESELLGGASDGLWASIGAPAVIQYDSSYEMWFTQGIDAFTVGNVLDLLLGTSLSLGYASDIPTAAPGPAAPAAVDYAEMDPEDAADELAEMDADDAADELVDMASDDAADIMAEMDAGDAADIIEEMASDDAADIMVEMDAEDAADIIEETAPEMAADIMEEIASDEAADILEEVATEVVADILEEMDIDDAAAVMEELSTDKLTETIPEMSEESLTERLPGLSPDTLYDIDPEVLFDSLPNAPTEQLISEEPPEPPAEAEAPIIVYTTPTGARYLAIRTWSGEWAVVMGTPIPIDRLMIKTKRALDNVETTVEIFEERPQEVAVGLAADQTVMAYISITFANATPEDIELGHMTFKVEKEWLEENSVHKWSVALNWYDPELRQWIALPTKRVEEDSSYVYYTSPITRFSMFAISGSEALPPVNFEVANLAINPTEAKTGQDITITADITNLSDEAGTYVASLWIDGTVEAGQDISLEANETKAVSFTVTRDVEGSYQVRLDRLFDSFSVTEVIEAPAAFTASNLTITPAEVDIGEEVTISVLVTNTGDLSGSYEVILKIDGVAVATKAVTLAGGASETITFTTAQDIAGTYSVTVDGLSGTFGVKAVVPPKPINWQLIAIIAGVTAAIVVPLVIRRRRRLA
jgi:PGF-pre-PGF domain-containing protein